MDINKNKKLKTLATWRTDNLYLSAFLVTKGLILLKIEKLSGTKSVFVFYDSPNRDVWLNQYHYSPDESQDCLVDARKFVSSIKFLKERLYQDNF